MKQLKIIIGITAVALILPLAGQAQGIAGEIRGLQGVLEQLYDEMMPLCRDLITVGQGIAGFAALWYIAARVWRHLAAAEPIDFYPLLRPFAIGMCILIFPSVLGLMNGVMKPTVRATAGMVEGSDKAIAVLLREKEAAIKESDPWKMYVGATGSGNRDRWYKYTHDNEDPSKEGFFEGIGNDIKFAMAKASYNFKNSVKEWMSQVLQVLFQAAALCIDTLRTFQLLVLAILGPLVFGLSVFDGFQHTLKTWLARYINIFLWLPVANIFGAIIGKIQEQMLQIDLSQISESGNTFFSSTDVAYLIFLLIGIVGYFSVPSVANYIVHAGGGGTLGRKVTGIFNRAPRRMAGMAMGGAGMVAGGMSSMINRIKGGASSAGGSTGRNTGGGESGSSYMGDKIKGNA